MKKSFLLGIASSFFFAFTFVLNRSMNLGGGHWIWSASLRFLFAYPIMALLVRQKFGFSQIHSAIKSNFGPWLLWSTIGFGLFYAPLSFAGDHGESWLIAASWQITIVMGIFMAPLFGKRIPVKNLGAAGVILIGVLLLQAEKLHQFRLQSSLPVLLPILIAAAAYPLGNRKMMQACPSSVSTIERVYGMLLCSLPFWMLLSLVGLFTYGAPGVSQVVQALCVAFFSGIIATVLFFMATDAVKSNQKQLALIESTQAGEVVFALFGGVLLLGDAMPGVTAFLGLLLIVAGMILNSLVSGKSE